MYEVMFKKNENFLHGGSAVDTIGGRKEEEEEGFRTDPNGINFIFVPNKLNS